MRQLSRNVAYLLCAFSGALLFWAPLTDHLGEGMQILREPHPGLKDDALKAALKKDKDKVHNELSYIQARQLIFAKIDGNGRRAECVYTGKTISYIGQPLPNNGAIEHAWPLTRLPAAARADLHHMRVAEGEARLARVNLRYGDVFMPVWSSGGSRSGPSKRGMPVFEVRQERRGDIAREMFYIATMYELDIPDAEEEVLRRWHKEDPVSADEQQRHEKIVASQRSRNPFIDHPGLTARVKNF